MEGSSRLGLLLAALEAILERRSALAGSWAQQYPCGPVAGALQGSPDAFEARHTAISGHPPPGSRLPGSPSNPCPFRRSASLRPGDGRTSGRRRTFARGSWLPCPWPPSRPRRARAVRPPHARRIGYSRSWRPLRITLPSPHTLECPHLVERESQRPRKLGNGVPASFPRPAFHIPYGGRGYSTLLSKFLYGKPPLLPYPPQFQAQPFF